MDCEICLIGLYELQRYVTTPCLPSCMVGRGLLHHKVPSGA